MTCKHCIDPNGDPCFPSYGPAPHKCFYMIKGRTIGHSETLPKSEWPDNFEEDPDCPGMGTYWCPHCGHGKPKPSNIKITLGQRWVEVSKGGAT